MVQLDEIEPEENSLDIEGILDVTILYLTSDDSAPIQSVSRQIPFKCSAQAAGTVSYTHLEVFTDTIVICTLTALVILCSQVPVGYGQAAGAELTIQGFISVYGNWV